ncbi:conserved hypothetical protein [Ricinus communis]|uniref:Uncharacterized protein n=1 Tax=Ricinus communis TaxID=3988 RepID=B9TDQ4_RICCO|nr:conserved hypothetical protein [Ricinus communis]
MWVLGWRPESLFRLARGSLSSARTKRLKRQDMNLEVGSLRWLIDKWVAPTPATPVRLIRYGGANSNRRRCVIAQSSEATRSLAIVFFRHDDGTWCVFPPVPRRPMMHAYPQMA